MAAIQMTANNTGIEKDDYDTESLLYDVLDEIFSYLGIRDLNNASRVCKSWYHVAKLERLRRGPQVMELEAMEGYVLLEEIIYVEEHKRVEKLKDYLTIKPSISIYFTDGKYSSTADLDSVPYEICITHQWAEPSSWFIVAVESLAVNIDYNPIHGEKNLTSVVFLPDWPTINYAATETSAHLIEEFFEKRSSLLMKMTDALFRHQAQHVCIIILMYQWKDAPIHKDFHDNYVNEVLNAIKNRWEPGTYSLWGAAINDIFSLQTATKPRYHSTTFCAMTISGTSFKSWSIVLKGTLPNSEIENKLLAFKESVDLRHTSLAFVLLPSDEMDVDRSRVAIFKSIFSTTRLISIFNNREYHVFCTNSMSNESNPELKHLDSYAIMVLTYKST